jgi:alkylated DNA repair dioxygenase AlkB
MLFCEAIELPSGGSVVFEARFLEQAAADAAMEWLGRELDWEARDIVLFGRRIPQPRLIAWCGDLPYRYSGQTLPARAVPPQVGTLLEKVSRRSGVEFNHVLANRYRNGKDSMGFHSDDEPELGDDPTIASLSFGTARRFVMRSRRDRHEPPTAFALGHGSLLSMTGACQRGYRHAIPKQPGLDGERISLTFRKLLRAPT